MPKIIIADEMEKEVIELLKEIGAVEYKPANLQAALQDADALVVRSATKVTAELIANATKLKVVARAGVGLDNVDIAACAKKGIKVLNTPGASTDAVAELAICFMIAACRNLGRAHFGMKNKKWEKKELIGGEIAGKTLGIVGYGRIGRLVAKKAKALSMSVIAFDPHSKSDEYAKLIPLEQLFSSSDILSFHCSVTEENKNMVNANSISKMKDGVIIINAARGALIDEDALYEACKSGKVRAAALDVYPSEPYSGKLLSLENIILTPHIGAATREAQERIGKELAEKLKEELKS